VIYVDGNPLPWPQPPSPPGAGFALGKFEFVLF